MTSKVKWGWLLLFKLSKLGLLLLPWPISLTILVTLGLAYCLKRLLRRQAFKRDSCKTGGREVPLSQGRVLVVDDQNDVLSLMVSTLQAAQYEVLGVKDGEAALAAVERFAPEVVVLDVTLPGIDGLSVCQQLRRTRTVPILMVSALSDDMDRIVGLEVGADDYLTKPFNPRELVARVRAMFRRLKMSAEPQPEDLLQRGELKLFLAARRVEVAGQEVNLTPIEFNLLRCLAQRPGATLTRQELLDRVWGPDFIGDERTTDSHVRNLRAKLRQANPTGHFVHSVWGVGYRFEQP